MSKELSDRQLSSLRAQAESLTKRLAQLQEERREIEEPQEPSRTGLFLSGSKARVRHGLGTIGNAFTGLGRKMKNFAHDTVVLGAHEREEQVRREREALLQRIKELESQQ